MRVPGKHLSEDERASLRALLRAGMSDVKTDVIGEAQRIVTGARRAAYGAPEDNFRRISDLWNAHLINTGRPAVFEPRDVAAFMILMKMARLAETPDHRDSIVDIIGYAACYAEMVLPVPTPGA